MKTQIQLLLLAATLFIVRPLGAQIVADGATNTLVNVTNSFTGDVTVGTNGSFTLLVLSNNSLLTNSAQGVIGRNATAKSNEVRLMSASARWQVGGSLFLGLEGAANRLTVSNGGGVRANVGDVGILPTSSNNLAVVTGAGSLWSNALELVFGFGSAGNQLVISNGGVVRNGVGYLGNDTSSSNNLAVVTDPGSLWTNSSVLYVGFNGGSGNHLRVSSGGRVVNSNGFLGFGITSRSNTALVTGPGSIWSNRNDLTVGNSGSGNGLVVSNGAAVYCGANGVVGVNSGARSNSVLVTGAGTSWTLADALYVGSNGPFALLVVSNGGFVQSSVCYLGHNASSSNNAAVVSGTGSLWTMPTLLLGEFGSGNRLVASNGGNIQTVNCYIGTLSASSNNTAEVTGDGSSWSAGEITVGHSGKGDNQLIVTNGGLVAVDFRVIVGNSSEATKARAIVDGGTFCITNVSGDAVHVVRHGTTVLNAGLMEVDNIVLTNSLGRFEFNGGTLVTRGAVISNGVPFVVGASGTTPAIWDVRAGVSNTFVSGDLIIGGDASFNQLILTNGALLTNSGNAANGILGQLSGANSNSALLAGAGAQWLLDDGVFVGGFGSGNRLVLSNGAALVTGSSSAIGQQLVSTNNEAVITGPGTTWMSSAGQLFVGFGGNDNRLLVSDGAKVVSFSGTVGDFFAASSNNLAVVTGAGSSWSNASELRVGRLGARNRLVVSNSAVVSAGSAVYVGFDSTSTNNLLTVDDGTLRVTNASLTGALDVRRGTNLVSAGLVEVDRLLVTNFQGRFEFNGGTLSSKSTTVNNGLAFKIGNGVDPATFILAGDGMHTFPALNVLSNATLAGNGNVVGVAVVLDGATLSPGASVGTMAFTNTLLLFGTVFMEISKNGAVLTNDQVQTSEALAYGGNLDVTNLGPTALTAGDKFKLFSAPVFTDSFQSFNLPPLGPGLNWSNKLLVDGSIEVFAPAAITMSSGSYTQSFDSLSMSGSANFWRDNSTLLGWYAARSVAPSAITSYLASDGSENNGALYSFGSSGSPERALGSIPSNATGDIAYGLCFTNDSASSVSNFVITWTGEQWRDGGGDTNTLTFWHQVSVAGLTNPEPGIVTNWTQVTNLNFASPTVLASATALDGNQATNRQVFSSVLIPGLAVPPGQTIFFRWHDTNDGGADQGMAVDDLIVAFAPVLPQFTSITINTTNGFAHFTGLGESNVTYGIQAASNLNSPIFWQLIGSNTADGSGTFQFTDPQATSLPQRFYRAQSP